MVQNSFYKIVSFLVVFSLLSQCQADVVGKSVMLELAKHYKNLGNTAICIADLFDDVAVQANTGHVIDGGIGQLKNYKDKSLTNEEPINISIAIASTATSHLQKVHEKCSNVGEHYEPTNTPPAGLSLSKSAQVFVEASKALTCVVQSGDAETLDKVPAFFGKLIKSLATDNGSALEILFRHETILTNDLKGLIAVC